MRLYFLVCALVVQVYGVSQISDVRFGFLKREAIFNALNRDERCAFIGYNIRFPSLFKSQTNAREFLTYGSQKADPKPSAAKKRTKTRRRPSKFGQNKTKSAKNGQGASDITQKEVEGSKKPLKSLQHESNFDIYPLKHEEDDDQQVPTLPPSEFRPKQSLGQNFITDWNIMVKMCNSLEFGPDQGTATGKQVVELGAGIGSLTQILLKKYPEMTAIEIDARAISRLSRTLPDLDIIHDDVLQV
ncbi:signal peptide-containing protein [Theileria equi strain WA]|uniref:rRNA adenine N(6)-methyltransferase n=1 Tax=Theileria equi strain WA TaxID=1537102 RepID=L0AZ83_THEEQ|nr:signal peptide-containing protein [Theileria equi strain WA]AFZ80870.1 signal peptide-containing protein [Theileria equi strain WA]|eukprot:XP_004830536.1 signal peptide-containing protein [Theileria equi strain WA]